MCVIEATAADYAVEACATASLGPALHTGEEISECSRCYHSPVEEKCYIKRCDHCRECLSVVNSSKANEVEVSILEPVFAGVGSLSNPADRAVTSRWLEHGAKESSSCNIQVGHFHRRRKIWKLGRNLVTHGISHDN